MDIRQQVEKDTQRVKPVYKEFLIDSMPDKPESAVCAKHGEYTFKYSESFGGNVLRSSSCMECESERNHFIDSEVLRIEREKKLNEINEEILRSGVSKRNLNKTFDTYNAETPAQVKAKASWQDFASSVSNGKPAGNIITCGSVGVGKTHLASSTVNQITHSGKKCRLIKIIDLIRQFKSTWSKDNDDTEEEFLHFYTNIPALIIDEVGVQFGSDTEKMIIFDIIDGRYNNMLPTALISNLALPDVQELIGERAIDRMREDGGVVVAMSWESHRGLK
jgi:DNA replication protein DnaC